MAVAFPVAENSLNSPQLLNKSSLRRLYDGFQCSFQVKSMTNTSKEFKNSEVVHMDFSPDGKYLAAGYE